ncbi:MAG TPA: HEAT repeat domain-containing protein [Candidatus Limnocylindrales bacterium]|nr:HEAT repeat domain-containing protein [Candidatus Limnocylindrales bacterium]
MATDPLAALVAESDEDRRWDALRDFVSRDPSSAREVGERGLASDDVRTRQVAADLLGSVASIDRSMAPAVTNALLPRLGRESEVAVLDALIVSLGHAGDPRSRSAVLAHAEHPDENIRLSVASSLPLLGLDADALAALRRLSADPDEDVRDWATFGLAGSDADDSETMAALAARTDDAHDDTRAEGILGLARRKDPRARGLIEREMARPEYGTLIEQALEELEA